MDISEVEKMNWKQDPAYVDASAKLQRITARGQEIDQRLCELKALITDEDRELIEARAGVLLGENPENSVEAIEHRLLSFREELTRLEVESAPIASAVAKLQAALLEIEKQAKARLAKPIEATIRATVEALFVCLNHAADLNSELHRLHRHSQRQDLKSAMTGTPSFKLLISSYAWCFLTQPNGEPSLDFRAWCKLVEPMLTEK